MILTKQKKQAGFTLIEVMVVVVILAILAAIVVPRILKRPEQARIVAAKQDITAIENALSLYKLDNGFYPSTNQGLQALVTKPSSSPVPENWAPDGYLKKVPVDPWGNSFQYMHPGQHDDIDIWSNGPPGDKKQVIGNWQSQSKS